MSDKLLSLFKKNLHLVFALLVFLAAFFWFLPVLDNLFVAEDFIVLELAQHSTPKDIINSFFSTPLADWAFRPFETVIFMVLFPFFGMNAFPYKLLSLLLYALDCVLVFVLARQLLKNNKLAFLSALIFTTFFLNYEIVFYAETLHQLLMRFALLSVIILFIKFRQNNKQCFLFVSSLALLLALFCEETALVVPIFLLAFDFFYLAQEQGLQKQLGFFGAFKPKLKAYLPVVAVVFVYFVLRFFATMEHKLLEPMNSLLATALNYRTFLVFLFSPFSTIREFFMQPFSATFGFFVASLLMLAVFAFVLFFVFFKSNSAALKFSLFWVLASIFVPSVLVSVQARYFFIPEVGASIFIVSLFAVLAKFFERKLQLKPEKVAILLACAWFLLALPQSYSYVSFQEKEWDAAGKTVQNTMQKLKYDYPSLEGKNQVFLLGQPGSKPGKFFWDSALIFRNIQYSMLNLLYGQDANRTVLINFSEREVLGALSRDDSIVFVFDRSVNSFKKAKSLSLGKNLAEGVSFNDQKNGFFTRMVFSSLNALPSDAVGNYLVFSAVSNVPDSCWLFLYKNNSSELYPGVRGTDFFRFSLPTPVQSTETLVFVPSDARFYRIATGFGEQGNALCGTIALKKASFEFEKPSD